MSNALSIYKNPIREADYMAAYDAVFSRWPVPSTGILIPTRFGKTHVNASGAVAAPPLILLPGNFTSSTDWFHNIAGLSRTNRVYAVDVMGDVGKSIPDRMPASRVDYADWLDDLLTGLKIEKTQLLGMSYGGFLAVNFALRFPQRVNRLVLLCPGLPLAPFTIHWMIRGMPMLLSSSRGAAEWFLAGASVKGYTRGDPVHEAFVTGVTALRSKSVMRPVIETAEWKQLHIPTLLLVGEKEILYDARAALQQAKALIPGIEAEPVPDAGHLLHFDQPGRVGESITRFLKAK